MKPSDSSQDLATVLEQGRSRPFLKWIFITLAVAALGVGAFFYLKRNPTGTTGPEYVTTPLERGEISIQITATGNLLPTNQVVIGSELSGTVAEVYVDTNDTVTKGQALAKLDTIKLVQQTERSRASLTSARARIAQSEATFREATASHERSLELHKLSDGLTPSKADMDKSRATVERAQADLESSKASAAEAEATVKSNERDLDKGIIRSPVNGTVLLRQIEVGKTVAASFTAPELFTIAEDLRKMELVVAVSEADIGRVANGQKVEFTVDAWPRRVYEATVKKVFFGSTLTNNVVTYSTELEVDNDDLSLRPGMTATADIFIEHKEDILVVPNTALRFDPVAAEKVGQSNDPSRTFVQQLSGPGRGGRGGRGGGGGGRGGPGGPGAGGAPALESATAALQRKSSVWILRNGERVEIPVTVGLTDGIHTEIQGEGLSEGVEVILSLKPALKK